MIDAQVQPSIAMTDPANNDDDFQSLFGRQWQEEAPPKDRAAGRKRPVTATKDSSLDPKSKQGSVEDQEKGSQTMVFPVKLHRLLESDDVESSAVVSWQPHGRAFLVHNKEAFVQKFLPSYFRQSKWASFQRQLNIYGFQRLTAGRDRGAYYHDLFLRGHPELAPRIHRMKLKGIGQGRHRTNAELEPNFYRMPPAEAGCNIDMQAPANQATAATASRSSPHATSNAQAQGTSTINVLQLFGGGGSGSNDQSQQLGSSIVLGGSNPDLSNLFFLSNGNEITGLQNLGGGVQTTGGNGTSAIRDSFDPQQEGVQSGQLSLLANLFNAAKNNSCGNNNGGDSTAQVYQTKRRNNNIADDDRVDDFNQWSNLLGNTTNASSFSNLLQNSDANLLSTTSIMQQYLPADSNSAEDRQTVRRQSDAAFSGAAGSMAPRSSPQSPWPTSLTGFGGSSSFAMHQSDHSQSAPSSGNQGSVLNGSNSCSDLVNTFGFDGPKFRRMSAAAMSTLLSSAGNNGSSSGNNFGNAFDSNTNLLLFSNLQRSRNSSSNLLDMPQTDSTATLTTAQALNMLGTAHSSSNATYNPASHQLALLNAANSGQSSGSSNGQGGFNFVDLLSSRAAASQPTFLDSVYEPIPIKEDGNPMMADTTVAANVSGQQQKLSAIAAARRGSGRGGFLQFHQDRL